MNNGQKESMGAGCWLSRKLLGRRVFGIEMAHYLLIYLLYCTVVVACTYSA